MLHAGLSLKILAASPVVCGPPTSGMQSASRKQASCAPSWRTAHSPALRAAAGPQLLSSRTTTTRTPLQRQQNPQHTSAGHPSFQHRRSHVAWRIDQWRHTHTLDGAGAGWRVAASRCALLISVLVGLTVTSGACRRHLMMEGIGSGEPSSTSTRKFGCRACRLSPSSAPSSRTWRTRG